MRLFTIVCMLVLFSLLVGCNTTGYRDDFHEKCFKMYDKAHTNSQIGSIVDANGSVVAKATDIYVDGNLTDDSGFNRNILWEYKKSDATYKVSEVDSMMPYAINYPANTDSVEVLIGNGRYVIIHTWVIPILGAYDKLKDKNIAKYYASYDMVYEEASAGTVLYRFYDASGQVIPVTKDAIGQIVGQHHLSDWIHEGDAIRYNKRLYLGYRPVAVKRHW